MWQGSGGVYGSGVYGVCVVSVVGQWHNGGGVYGGGACGCGGLW